MLSHTIQIDYMPLQFRPLYTPSGWPQGPGVASGWPQGPGVASGWTQSEDDRTLPKSASGRHGVQRLIGTNMLVAFRDHISL